MTLATWLEKEEGRALLGMVTLTAEMKHPPICAGLGGPIRFPSGVNGMRGVLPLEAGKWNF